MNLQADDKLVATEFDLLCCPVPKCGLKLESDDAYSPTQLLKGLLKNIDRSPFRSMTYEKVVGSDIEPRTIRAFYFNDGTRPFKKILFGLILGMHEKGSNYIESGTSLIGDINSMDSILDLRQQSMGGLIKEKGAINFHTIDLNGDHRIKPSISRFVVGVDVATKPDQTAVTDSKNYAFSPNSQSVATSHAFSPNPK